MSASFPLLALVDEPRIHFRAADKWVREKAQPSGSLSASIERRRDKKIHIAYLSADYHDHATSYLMAELFESHDRDRFELTAISFGPDHSQAMRQRVSAAFDRFEDVRRMSDVEVARRCRELGVDIAVDLKGFTQDSRLGILAERCAPIQINWLGYPGTMAAPFIDYIVADRTLITEAELEHYTEKVIWLPDTYQVNDSQRHISDKNFTRAECGLPESAFVFCCFNNNYKILPTTFDVWMRLLDRVPSSVLWLLEDNPIAAKNLRAEAIARGVDGDRLVFAKRIPLPQHLARHRVADLFIDTWPCNAHTTASDALWAGLPVLTRSGRSFASRVAASLLNAIGLPELITQSEQDYEELAVALAQDSERLQALKKRLSINRTTYPLFNCKRFTKNLESAYYQVMERHWA
jgi:predicted O-linked N-acetylglucosamine transferase (SPINDLY family)